MGKQKMPRTPLYPETMDWECRHKQRVLEIVEKGNDVKGSADFKSWDLADMSELFWHHLGIYQKEPNAKSIHILKTAYLWAVHADKALANAFSHALTWIGVDNLLKECKKWE